MNRTIHRYSAVDNTPVAGVNYYRLKMVDQDNNFRYGPISRVDLNKRFTVTVLPNPARQNILVQGASLFRQLRIVDAQGRIVKTYPVTGANPVIDIGALPNGIYIIHLSNDQEFTSITFQKQ